MEVYVRDGRIVRVEGMEEHPFNRGDICVRTRAVPAFEDSPDRLTYPMLRSKNTWKRISWDQVLDTIADKLSRIKQEYRVRAVTFGFGSIRAEDHIVPFVEGQARKQGSADSPPVAGSMGR